MSMTWQCWTKRSTRAATHAAPGNTVPHCLKGKFVVNVVFLDDEVRFPRDASGASLRSFEWHENMKAAAPVPGLWPLPRLYAAYEDAAERFLLIPHVGGRRAILDWHHPELERLVELASSWGHFDWLYREALARVPGRRERVR